MQQEILQFTAIYSQITTFLVDYSFQIIGAIIVVLAGTYVANKIRNVILTLCRRRAVDVTLAGFIANSVRLLFIAMTTIIALGKLGISVTPFVAAIGALSLGAGLAIQGLVANYGAGFNIILARPFVVGDTISVKGVSGIVEEVHLAYTLLSDEDGVRISIPNKHIVGEILHNSQKDSIVEMIVSVGYRSDPRLAIRTVLAALQKVEGISTEREPLVGIDSFGTSGMNLGIRFWARTAVRFESQYVANLAIHDALQAAGIAIPCPQQEVRLLS
jgi:small conductance mechanosensitive channel